MRHATCGAAALIALHRPAHGAFVTSGARQGPPSHRRGRLVFGVPFAFVSGRRSCALTLVGSRRARVWCRDRAGACDPRVVRADSPASGESITPVEALGANEIRLSPW
jgi:hypothetical protein